MKILFIEPCHVGFGGYFRAFAMAKALSLKGIKVDLLVSSPASLRIKKVIINENLTQYELPRYNIHFYFNGRLLRAMIGLFFGLFRRYDVIHVFVPVQLEANIPGYILKKLGKKVVMDWDDYWEGGYIYEKKPPILIKYVSFCENKAPRCFENYVTASDFLLQKAKDNGAKKAIKIINGVNREQFCPHTRKEAIQYLNIDDSPKYILTFGNTFPKDRAFQLFCFMDEVISLDKNVKLVTNMPKEILLSNAREVDKVNLNVLDSIISVGYIKQEELGYYLGLANIALFLTGELDTEIACFSIRIGSYLNGEAIIAMNDINSEANNTLRKFNCAIIERDIAELAKQAVAVMNEPKIYAEYKANTIRAKESLSWELLTNDLIGFYDGLL